MNTKLRFSLGLSTLILVVVISSLGMHFLSSKTFSKIITHPLYAANYSDNEILVGSSHDVFVGKIIAQIGERNFLQNPATQFSVEVVKNIKGKSKDLIVLNQEGGYQDETLYLMEDSNGLLQIGSTYLFATRYDHEGNFHTLNPHPNASKLLRVGGSENLTALGVFADQDEKVKTLEAAYPEEKLLDADIAHNNTRNAFKDLPPEEKTAAKARADKAKASLDAQKKNL